MTPPLAVEEQEQVAREQLFKMYSMLKQFPQPIRKMMEKKLLAQHEILLKTFPNLPSIKELLDAPVQPLKIVAGDEV